MTEPLNWSIATEQSATSTSDLAKRAAANGAPSGQAFLAIEQTAGRGRHGRHWDSQKGGMYLSILLRPSVPVDQWFALSFVASLSVLEAVRGQLATHLSPADMPQTGLKWPNDVIVEGGKISGILLEVEGKALIVGSGINIAPVENIESQYTAPIALADIWPDRAGDLPHPHDLATAFLDRLDVWYGRFCQLGFGSIRDAWLENALFLDKRVVVQCDTKALSGVFRDLGMDGTMLLLDDSGQTLHITTGDVKLMGN